MLTRLKGPQSRSDSFAGVDSLVHGSALVRLDDDGGLLLRHVGGVCMRKGIFHQYPSDFTKELV